MKVSPLISRRITEARLGPYDEGFFFNTVNSYYPSTIFVKSSNIVVSQVPEYATEINCYHVNIFSQDFIDRRKHGGNTATLTDT